MKTADKLWDVMGYKPINEEMTTIETGHGETGPSGCSTAYCSTGMHCNNTNMYTCKRSGTVGTASLK